MKHTILIGLGSNIGDRIEFLVSAIRGITDLETTVVDDVSNVYETEPVGNVPQNSFLNLCISVKTDMDHVTFHRKMKELEKFIGRTESVQWGPREIDIDILFFDSIVVASDTLTIPHREIVNRKFVLLPLSEIAMHYVHPVVGITIGELLKGVTDTHTIEHSDIFTSQLLTLINDSITNPIV